MADQDRQDKYRKNAFAEKYLAKMNAKLETVDESIIKELNPNAEASPVFIVGLQRSGTTLFNQLLINHFDFAYPSNFLARFWNAPLTALLLQDNLNFQSRVSYESNLGYTEGLSGPHEFGYFWRHWFPWDSFEDTFQKSSIDNEKFAALMKGMQQMEDKPWVFKNLHKVNFQIETLHQLFPRAVFLYIKRDPLYVMQSTYQSRLELFGDVQEWFGIQPPEYEKLKSEPVMKQIAGQLHYSERYIENSLEQIDPKHIFKIDFEHLVADPQKALDALKGFFEKNAIKIKTSSEPKLPSLKNSNQIRLNEDLVKEMREALKDYYDGAK